MKKFIKEFTEFINRGNVLSMAIGFIIGGACQNIVDSLVNDIMMPFLGIFINKDFSFLVLTIGDVDIRYGAFITSVLNFLIMAFIVFFFVKYVNILTKYSLKALHIKEEEIKAATTKKCPYCMSEIDINAVKCPHCISDLSSTVENKEE